jgi:hypothetical protein
LIFSEFWKRFADRETKLRFLQSSYGDILYIPMDWRVLVVVGGGEEREDDLLGFVEKEL